MEWAGASFVLGYAAGTDQLEGLKYINTYTTERKYYEKDRLTGKEHYMRTEWIGKTKWQGKIKGGNWTTIYNGSATFSLK